MTEMQNTFYLIFHKCLYIHICIYMLYIYTCITDLGIQKCKYFLVVPKFWLKMKKVQASTWPVLFSMSTEIISFEKIII